MIESPISIDVPTQIDEDGSELRLLVPFDDVTDPEVSIVIPALNEEITIGLFVDWCLEGLSRAKVKGEVIIVDSSTDSTEKIALSRGARVLKAPRRGLGRAYIDALPFIRGKYVLMGDADCTYDFRNLEPFMEAFRNGHQYVMGSRFRGYIEPGSMPPLHQYFGTPLTTWILNFLYASRFSDIHCGMRGITRDALARMDLHSQSWEYASENGPEIRAHEPSHRGSSGSIFERPGRTFEPPQALRLVFTMACSVDQPESNVYLWSGLLSFSPWIIVALVRDLADSAYNLRSDQGWSGHVLTLLDVAGIDIVRSWVARVLCWRPCTDLFRLPW